MTRRFDRPEEGGKRHMSSLFGLAHMAYAAPGAHGHSYEDYFNVIDKLDLPIGSKLEAFRRMAFNVLGCNRDDHTKNFGFLLNAEYQWELAPTYDVAYAFNPEPGKWTATQQLSIRGKREAITAVDMIALGRQSGVATAPKLKAAIEQVREALADWPRFAATAGVSERNTRKIANVLPAP